jgi:hypothetical protein
MFCVCAAIFTASFASPVMSYLVLKADAKFCTSYL